METELKLDIATDGIAALRSALADLSDPSDRTLASTYHDTAERDLRAAGFTLRVRWDGATHVQTVKAEGAASAGLFARPEWERSVPDATPAIDATAGPIAPLLAGKSLVPCFETVVRRAEYDASPDGARVALALDEGVIRAGDREVPLAELELELKEGTVHALFALARSLDAVAPLRLGVASKAERGHRLAECHAAGAVKAEPVALDRAGDVGAAFETIVRNCLRHFRSNEDLLLTEDAPGAEAVHQARVALRRLRSAFSLFKPVFGDDVHARRFSAELRLLAAALGEVRDLDVLIERYDGQARARIGDARHDAFACARGVLEAPATRRLMLDLAEWLALGDWRTGEEGRAPVLTFAADLLRRRRKRVRRKGRHLARLDDHQRHEVRIEAKKLRYAIEFLAGLWPGGKARRRRKIMLRAVEALQERLGHLNDAAMATAILARIGLAAADRDPAKTDDRRSMLARAGDAYDDLVEAKRFWT